MNWREVDLNQLLACCRRELAFRQRCYPRWIDKGTISAAKAEREIALMQSLVEFLIHCIFKAVTRPPVSAHQEATAAATASADAPKAAAAP